MLEWYSLTEAEWEALSEETWEGLDEGTPPVPEATGWRTRNFRARAGGVR
jgi:hypothetical protein